MKILHKTITADAAVYVGDCYFIGADLYHTTDTNMIIYNEATATKTAAQIIAKPAVTDEMQNCNITIPLPGIKCEGIYVDWTAGLGTIYYAIA